MRNILKTLIAAAALLPATALADEILGGEGHYYHIVWHKTPSLYLTETTSGVLQVEDESNTARQYWQFEATGNEHCYYIKNAVTGRYIEACKTAKDNTYNISTTTTPVEYYVCPEATFDGAYRFTSTNCANYFDTSKTPVGLNKNGSNSYIITWDAGTTNAGSYWDVLPTEFDYDTDGAQAQSLHSDYARSAQIYFMPCGSHYSSYLVRKLHLGGDAVLKELDYPCVTWSGSTKKSGTPVTNTWWTIFTTDKAQVTPGSELQIDISLGKAVPEGYLAQLCFDWDRDGVFEDVKTIDNPLSKTLAYAVSVPANAKEGQSRMRFRLTDNGLTDPDDEVSAGQILDCIIETAAPVELSAERDLTVCVNDPNRGTAVTTSTTPEEPGTENANLDEVGTEGSLATIEAGDRVTATATPLGNARFLCWLEGRIVVSTAAVYEFEFVRPTHLKAMFSVNTAAPTDGIREVEAEAEDQLYETPLYYDLSGRLVSTPVKGETYIRKESSKTGTIVIF